MPLELFQCQYLLLFKTHSSQQTYQKIEIMTYLKKMSSLQEKALYQVTLNLCQDMSFKEEAMCLEKPTYGLYLYDCGCPYFMGGPKLLSLLSKMKCSYGLFSHKKVEETFGDKVVLWEAAIKEQSQKLTERLPNFIKHQIHVWIHRIALEYLSYSRRQELLFGVSCYFLMDFLTRSDWTDVGRLNERKLAKRLIKDERLTIMQRYRIACVYCLHVNIPFLWSKLTQEEKQSISLVISYQENDYLVSLWTYYMIGHSFYPFNHPWVWAAQKAVHLGNQAALLSCWKRLNKSARRQLLIDMALQALKRWKSSEYHKSWQRKLVSNKHQSPFKRPEPVKRFNLPSYYSEMMRFLLSKMSESQKILFFKSAFERDEWDSVESCYISILDCFLDWPLQDFFMPTMNFLWGITPMKNYGLCLLSLVSRSEAVPQIHYYDFQSILWNLWEQTPEYYKEYAFCHNNEDYNLTVIKQLFLMLLLKSDPFQQKDVAFFRQVWCDLPQEVKKDIICSLIGGRIICTLVEKEMWSLVNWMAQETVPIIEISKLKEQFIKSNYLTVFWKLEKGCDEQVEKLIDWSIELVSDKSQYKYDLINYNHYGMNICSSSLKEGNFTKVERMINFCLHSDDERKNQFQLNVVKNSCSDLFINNLLEQIDKILAWHFKTEEEVKNFKNDNDIFGLRFLKSNCCALIKHTFSLNNLCEKLDKILAWKFDTEKEIKDFKMYLFNADGINIYFYLIFNERRWDKVKWFYKWFCLSPEDIEKFKNEAIFAAHT